jgi:RNA polymerase sigma-70 factor (TIGR02943 family)
MGALSDPETWVEQYGDYLYRYALSRIQDPSTAEDLVQETLLAALHARKNFKGRSSERTWLTSILKNKIVDHFRKIKREQVVDEIESYNDSMNEFFDEKGGWKAGPAKWIINPNELLERKEFWKVLSRCLSELSTLMARAFMLREMDGLSTEEICKVLNISSTNCWGLLHRARMNLRRCLEIKWFHV